MDCQYTGQNINVSNVLLKQKVEVPIDSEIMLPDYCSDIKRMLKCKVKASVTSKSINGDNLDVEGEAIVWICYVDEDNKIKSFEERIPFSRAFDLPSVPEMPIVEVKVKSSFINCKAVTQRRIDVHCSLNMKAVVKSFASMKIVTDIDEPCVQQQRDSSNASILIGADEKYLIVSDEMGVADTADSIKSIIRSETKIIISDTKIIGNKVVVKGDLKVKILYLGEESGGYFTAQESFPFSQILDINGLTENCTCYVDTSVLNCEARPQTDMSGMLRKAIIGAKLYLSVTAFCNSKVPFLTDAYSTNDELSLTIEPLKLERVAYTYNDRCQIAKKLDVPIESIETVIDMWCEAECNKVSLSNGHLGMLGTLCVSLLANDSNDEPQYFERNVEFELDTEVDPSVSGSDFVCSVMPYGITSTQSRGGLEVKADVHIRIDVVESASLDVITNAELGDKLKSKYGNSSIVIYRAEGGERLWDIAKRYNTSVSSITGLNSLSGETVADDMTIVIPVGIA